MSVLVVVNDPDDWPLLVPGADVVAAWDYLTQPEYTDMGSAKVFNLCRSYRYQSTGYYVSLLAAARGHTPLPDVTTIQDLRSQAVVRAATEGLDGLIQQSLAPLQSSEFVLSIYFGQNLAKRYARLSQALFKTFQAPLLRAVFTRGDNGRGWQVHNVLPLAASDIPADHRDFAVQVAGDFFRGRRRVTRRRAAPRFDVAVLHDPTEPHPPSNARALKRFIQAADALGMAAELIGKEDYGRLAEFDALFIRETTRVNHHTYRFSRRAAALGLVVVDDPESILKCTNKVFLAELTQRQRITVPRTLIVHRDNVGSIARELGFPCVLKQPDSTYSLGVVKVDNEQALDSAARELLEASDLVVAQAYLPTPFDWRIGVLDRQPFYACKYYMARSHWQIIHHDNNSGKQVSGRAETLPIQLAPTQVVRTALRAANSIGDGLYGVDLKEHEGKCYLIEVNDNPTIDAGVEDAVLKDELYYRLMAVVLRRIEQRKEVRPWR